MEKIELVKAQMQTLIDLANETTGKQDTTLTDGVGSLTEQISNLQGLLGDGNEVEY